MQTNLFGNPVLDSVGKAKRPRGRSREENLIDFWTEIGKRNNSKLQEMLHRESAHTGLISDGVDYSACLLAAVAIEENNP